MKNFLILKFLDRLEWLFRLFNLDYEQIRLVLQLKLTESSRRSNFKFSQTKKKKKKNKTWLFYILLLILGMLFAVQIAFISVNSHIFAMAILFSLNLYFILITLFSEFSVTFFDLKDAQLLLPSPLNEKSLSIAKNIYLFWFFLRMTLLLSLPSIVFYGYYHSWYSVFAIVFMLIMLVFFLISFVSILYGILLNFFSGEKLKDFTNYMQGGVTLLMFFIYQIVLQFGNSVVDILSKEIHSWMLLIPPFWFASLTTIANDGLYSSSLLILLGLGIVVPIIFYLIFLDKIAPFFESNLYKMNINNETKKRAERVPILCRLFPNTAFANFYNFSLNIFKSDRKIKMSIYPLMAMSLFFPFLLLYNAYNQLDGDFSKSKSYFVAYFTVMFSIQFCLYIYHSEYYKASWIFRYLPINKPGSLLKGTVVSLYTRFQLPLFLVMSVGIFYFWGKSVLPHILIFFLNGMIAIMMYMAMGERMLPFSNEIKSQNSLSMKGGAYLLTSLVFVPLLTGIHFVITKFSFGIILLPILQSIVLILFFRNYFDNMKWVEIKETE